MASILRITSSVDLPAPCKGGVVAIGNFDGVHRGHQVVLQRALVEADRMGVPAVVLTFEPHPRVLFQPAQPLFRITPAPMRARLLGILGFQAVVEQAFTREFSALSAEEFVQQVLVEQLGVAHVVTGFDFHFGRDRQGGPAYLIEAGKKFDFGVSLVDAFCDEAAEIVSSTRIRKLLSEGDVSQAAGLLGYRYTVEATVTHGKKLGRELGFPTANMVLDEGTHLRHGIYAVRLRRPDGTIHDGVANFGRRPTVDDDGEPLLETFVFDFSDSLYDEDCTVSFFGFLRGEEKFDGLDPLILQMKRDVEEARALLSGISALSNLDQQVGF